MRDADGRPVQWFNIHNPPFQQKVDQFNYELWAASFRHPNLKVIDWAAWSKARPEAFVDGVHVATWQGGCVEGRNRLVQLSAPAVPGAAYPTGYWYEEPAKSGPVKINGWAAGADKQAVVQVNIRANYKHVDRISVSAPTTDPWALTASGRAFHYELPAKYRGQLICVDVVDDRDQFTSLGCRRV